MTDRVTQIREAAERARERAKQLDAAPVGRWIRIENALGAPVNGAQPGNHRSRQRQFVRAGRTRAQRVWGVVLPMKVERGTRIKVENWKGHVGLWYVEGFVPTPTRSDGSYIATVSKRPVAATPEPERAPHVSVEEARKAASAIPPKVKRNPRVCEECEGPCRPGAGACDRCRGRAG